jgi:hypothetical protein
MGAADQASESQAEPSDKTSERAAAPPGGGEKGGIPTWLQIVLAVAGICITIVSTFFAVGAKNEAALLAQQLANAKEIPRIEQSRFVFAGDVLKAVTSGKKTITVEGLPNPEFAATPLGRQIMDQLKKVTGVKPLRAISVEFISFTNKGPRAVENLKALASGEDPIELGSVAVNTTKLLPVVFENKEVPIGRIKSQPTSYTASYTLLGERHELTAPIAPRATPSWIPTLGNPEGLSRGLSDEDMERYLEQSNQP